MKIECSAVHEGGKKCKATKDLVAARIATGGISGSLKLPSQVVIHLCPKHFEVRA